MMKWIFCAVITREQNNANPAYIPVVLLKTSVKRLMNRRIHQPNFSRVMADPVYFTRWYALKKYPDSDLAIS
jgi:hypothetical protein